MIETLVPSSPEKAWQKGSEFVASHTSLLPPFCVRCGQAMAGEPLKKNYSWHSPMLYLMIVFPGLLFYAIVAMIVSKKMSLSIPLCEDHMNRYRQGRQMGTFMMLAGIPLALTVSGVLPEQAGWGWLVGVGTLVAGAVVFALADGFLRPTHIDKDFGTFRGAGETFLALLPKFAKPPERN